MADLDRMTLEKFKLWTPNALRVYLSLRNKQISGNFEELAARAFIAWEEKINVDVHAEHKERLLLAEYQQKLKEMVNEYKEGKAYRYFSVEWVKEIFYHDFGGNCEFVKSKVSPSQAVKNKPYDVWIIVRKDIGSLPGGEILSGYCTCTAGMLGSCNHIAGVLFRMEHAVKIGMTKPSSTSKSCSWNVPSRKTTITPGRVSDCLWKKSHYTKLADSEKENAKQVNRKLFTPLSKYKEEQKKDSAQIRKELYNSLKNDLPNSCFCLVMEKRRINNASLETTPLPLSLKEISAGIKKQGKSVEECSSELLEKIEMNHEQISALSTATLSQSYSDTWRKQREGRITASIFHRVSLRSKTLQRKPNEESNICC